jgi:hypothetical protein
MAGFWMSGFVLGKERIYELVILRVFISFINYSLTMMRRKLSEIIFDEGQEVGPGQLTYQMIPLSIPSSQNKV